MSGDPMLSCRDLSKSYGPVRALEGVSLAAERGAILAILGPSGCGKTTLLRMLAGLETPDEGSAWWTDRARMCRRSGGGWAWSSSITPYFPI